MKDWFDALDSRERQFVIAGSVVSIIAILYGMIWAPLATKQRELGAEVSVWQQSLADLRPLRATLGNGQQQRPAVDVSNRQSPLIIVDQTLQSRGLNGYRRNSQPTSSNGIRVVFENVAFDELILWLGDLSEGHAMHVQNGSFSVASQSLPGRINATLTLERSL